MPFAQFATSADVSMFDPSLPLRPVATPPGWHEWPRSILPIATALLLLTMGAANIAQRATSDDVEDGVLWLERSAGVVASEVAADSAAERAGIKAGDVLLAVDGQPVTERDQVIAVQLAARAGDRHTYTVLRQGTREVTQVTMAPLRTGAGGL